MNKRDQKAVNKASPSQSQAKKAALKETAKPKTPEVKKGKQVVAEDGKKKVVKSDKKSHNLKEIPVKKVVSKTVEPVKSAKAEAPVKVSPSKITIPDRSGEVKPKRATTSYLYFNLAMNPKIRE